MKWLIQKSYGGTELGRGVIIGDIAGHLQALPLDKAFEVEIRPYRSRRTVDQNAALFGVLYPPLMEFVGLSGDRDKQDLHEYFCGEFFGWREVNVMGKTKHQPKRTTTTDEEGKSVTIDVATFNEFIAFIQQRAAENGCVLPDPDPHLKVKK